jgi:hypothetical protein
MTLFLVGVAVGVLAILILAVASWFVFIARGAGVILPW